MPKLSIQHYARTRGKSRTAIYKAIREGRIREAVSRSDAGKIVLDAELADLELSRNTDPTMQRDPEAIRSGIEATKDPTAGPLFNAEPPATVAEPAADSKAPESARTAQTLSSSKAALAQLDARMRRLDLEERMGKLVSTQGVEVEVFKANRTIRDMLRGIGRKAAPRLVGEGSEEKIRAVIDGIVETVLLNLSDEFKLNK